MKIIITRALLLDALTKIGTVVEKRNTIPILAHIRIQAEAGSITFSATNLDLEITHTLDTQAATTNGNDADSDKKSPALQIETGGVVCAPASTLSDIINRTSDKDLITLAATEAHKLTITAGRARFVLETLTAEDFPTFATPDYDCSFALPVDTLQTLLKGAEFAMSKDESRIYLNGIYFHTTESATADKGKGAALACVATDGHRLAYIETDQPQLDVDMPSIIIPRRSVPEVLKLCEQPCDTIALSIASQKVCFKTPQTTLVSGVVSGTYPDYKRVIPSQDAGHILNVSAPVLVDAVNRVSAVANETSRAVKLNLSTNNMQLDVSTPNTGTGLEDLNVDYKGNDTTIGFNYQYLIDIGKQLKAGHVEMHIQTANDPVLIRNNDDGSVLYVIMPMRI